MQGYLDDEQATCETINTGDIGQLDARGYLKTTGRLKE